MKILMITPDFEPNFGGIGVHVQNLIKNISRHKEYDITLLVCKMRRQNDDSREYNSNLHIDEKKWKNIRILDFNSGIQTKVDMFYKDKPIFKEEAYHDFRTITNCCDIETRILENLNILEKHYDLIHLHDAFNGPLAVLLKKIYQCPLITTIHGINAEEYTMIDNLKRYTIFNADFLITVNSEIKELIKARYLANKPTEVIFNSIDLEKEEDIQKNIEAQYTPPYYLTFCGRIDMYKGLEVLLHALKILLKKEQKVKLLIIGDGLLKPQMEDLAHKLGIHNEIIWKGILTHEEVMQLYKKSFCIIVPSRKEPFSTVALEGMAFGIPVICSNIGGFNEIKKI